MVGENTELLTKRGQEQGRTKEIEVREKGPKISRHESEDFESTEVMKSKYRKGCISGDMETEAQPITQTRNNQRKPPNEERLDYCDTHGRTNSIK